MILAMKHGLVLTVAVILILAGAVTSWWRTPAPDDDSLPGALTLLAHAECTHTEYQHVCHFQDDASTLGSARRWTFLVGIVASALLVSAHAAPGGTRTRRGLGSAAIVGSALALVAGLGLLCVLVWMGVEARSGHPGIGGFLFTFGAVLGLRSSRVIAADPSA